MKKEIESNGKRALVTIRFNTHGEKHIGGERYHSLEVKGINCEYSQSYEINTNYNLEDEVVMAERFFLDYTIKSENKSIRDSVYKQEIETLSSLGFE